MMVYDRKKLLKKQSSKFTNNRRWKNVLIGLLSATIMVSWTFLISRLTYIEALSIRNVDIQGTDQDIIAKIRAKIYEQSRGEYLGLFSKANIFLFPESSMTASIMDGVERVKNVSISRKGLDTLVVTVYEKDPAAIICLNLPNLNSDNENDSSEQADRCYFADPTGKIYMRAPSFSAGIFNRYFVPDLSDDISEDNIIGTTTISGTKFRGLQAFYEGVHRAGIVPLGMLVKDGDEYEFYVSNPDYDRDTSVVDNHSSSTLSDAVVIYLNDHNDLSNELSNLVSFWSHTVDTARAKKEPKYFDSIDLRYGSNVFYREKR